MVKFLTINGHTLAVRHDNPETKGFPIIFLPGVMASLPFWTPSLVEPFQSYGPCSVLTLPGHYPATFPAKFTSEGLTSESMAELLHNAIRSLTGDVPALLVGHSTGGFAALAIAAYYPQSVNGVVSVAGFAQGRWSGWLRIFQNLARHPLLGLIAFRLLRAAGSSPMMFGLMAAYHTPIPKSMGNSSDRKMLINANHEAFCHYEPRSMQIYFDAVRCMDILSDLARINVPVLLIHGDSDPAVPPIQSKRINTAISQSELIIIPGRVGHMPFYQKPLLYRNVIDSWLSKNFKSNSPN